MSGFDALRFAEEIESCARRVLDENSSDARVRSIRMVQQLAEETCDEVVGEDTLIACRAGCSHCCIVNVAVLPPEAESVAAYLAANRTRAELSSLYRRLSELEIETRCLDDEERIMVRKPCAFLDCSGSCDIYPVRPLLCRAVTSTSAENCREALAMVAFGEQRPVVANLVHRSIFETAFTSFGKALDQHDQDSRSQRLAGSVRRSLEKCLH